MTGPRRKPGNAITQQGQADGRWAEAVLPFEVEPEPCEDAGVEYRIEEHIGIGAGSSKTAQELLVD
jgi:hypothetical protein